MPFIRMQFQTFHGIALNEFFFPDCKQNHQRKKFQETATSLSQDLGVSTKSVQSVIDLSVKYCKYDLGDSGPRL